LTEGQPRLQRQLALLMKQRGIDFKAEEILVTAGSQQAIDLVARAFLNPGDTVAIEAPSYLAAIQVFDLCQFRPLQILSDAHGARVETLPQVGQAMPKLAYLVTNFANPSGATLSLERRVALLKWAAANEVFVLEDDPYGELRYRGAPAPALVTIARDIPGAARWCGYASSLSKIVSPGLRVGWLCLPDAVHDVAARIKQALDLQTSSFVQEIAAEYLESGRLAQRLPVIRATYNEHCDALSDALTGAFGEKLEFNRPDGGMFLWARFAQTPSLDTRKLLELARNRGVIFVPGAAFYPEPLQCNSLRLSFSTATPAELREGAKRLRTAYDELLRLSENRITREPA
jgi:2-aminoadipate transaminase